MPQQLERLRAIGVNVSARTVLRWRARQRPTWRGYAEPDDEVPTLEAAAGEALATGNLEHLTRVRDELARAMARWVPFLGSDGSAVRSYSTLGKALGELVARIESLTPPVAPDPETDPGYVGAKARLLAKVEEILSRGS